MWLIIIKLFFQTRENGTQYSGAPVLLRPPIEKPFFNNFFVRKCQLEKRGGVTCMIPHTTPLLLKTCEDHSRKLGYQWNPSKCMFMSATDPPLH